MLRRSRNSALGFALAPALCCAVAAHVQAQTAGAPESQAAQPEVVEYYDYYRVGYDTTYDDDWFFDYFAYDAAAFEPQYDYYADYDYQAERFDWEETGLFDTGRGAGQAPARPGAGGGTERGL